MLSHAANRAAGGARGHPGPDLDRVGEAAAVPHHIANQTAIFARGYYWHATTALISARGDTKAGTRVIAMTRQWIPGHRIDGIFDGTHLGPITISQCYHRCYGRRQRRLF